MNIKEMRSAAGMSQQKFGDYGIYRNAQFRIGKPGFGSARLTLWNLSNLSSDMNISSLMSFRT